MITMQYHMMVSTHRNILLLHHTSASSQPYYCIITTSHYHYHSHTSINSSHPFIHRHPPSIMYESLLVPTSSPGVSSLARTRPGIGRNTVWRVEVFTTAPLPNWKRWVVVITTALLMINSLSSRQYTWLFIKNMIWSWKNNTHQWIHVCMYCRSSRYKSQN